MKAILEFNLPEDDCDFKIASRAMDWALSAWEVDQKLRGFLKHGHAFETIDAAIEGMRTFLRETLDDHGVNLEDIT